MDKSGLLVLWVRINPKVEVESRFRCGIQFTREWGNPIEVDAATAQRLQEDQVLEVTDVDPNASASAAEVKASVPTDPAERAAAIKASIRQLDVANAALWKADGAPTTAAIETLTGWFVSAAERDAVWAEIKAA